MNRRKPGPKVPGNLGPLRQRTVLLDDLAIHMLEVVGGGNLSHAIRQAARIAYDRYQATPDTTTAASDVPALPIPPGHPASLGAPRG